MKTPPPPTTQKNDSITADVRSESAKYAGIYNFIDPRDPITQMPLYGWGFSRAGKQIPLPSLITAGSIANEIYTDKMDGLFDSFGFGNYSDNMEPYADSNTVYVFSELSGYIKSADEYYSKQCGSEDSDIITAYKFFHDGIAAAIANSSEDTTSLISTIAVGASTEELYGLTNYFIRNSIDGSLVFTHMPQNYIAGVMQLKTTDDLLRGDYYRVNIEPALNVTVRNADNNAVGQVKDGAAVQYSQGVYSNGTDIDIYLPEDEKFTVSMTGRGSEKVTVTVYRENAVTGRIKESYSIKDISAEAGTKLGLTLKEDGSSILGVLRDLEEGAPYSEIYRASFTEPVTVGDPDEADNEDTDDGSVTVDNDSAPTPSEDDGPSVTEYNAPTDDDTDAPAQTYPEPAQTYPEPDAFITDDPDPDGNPPTGTTLPTAAIAALITAAASRKRSR